MCKICWKQSGTTTMLHFLWLQTQKCKQNHEGNKVHIQLDGIQSCQVHLHEPILPVNPGDPVVMDASWYVTKPFPIFPKAVVLVIHAEWARGCQLQVRKVWLAPEIPSLSPSDWCSLRFNGSGVASQLTRACYVRGILVICFIYIIFIYIIIDIDIYFFSQSSECGVLSFEAKLEKGGYLGITIKLSMKIKLLQSNYTKQI